MASSTDTDRGDARRFAAFAGARVLVTGGLGFIGSNLVRRLAALGAEVRVLDALLPDSGGNVFNLADAVGRITVERCDIRDPAALRGQLADRDYLFSLAAHTSHQGSMNEPLLDLDINARAPLALLDACRSVNPKLNIVFASTRQIYGKPEYLPVDERHPVRPVDVNGINMAAGESFHLLYHRIYGMRCTALRLTNTYGPRMRIADAKQTFVGIWLRLALEGKPFPVWGGDQLRDFTYVDDLVAAFLHAAATPETAGRAFNIGGTERGVTLRRLAELVVAANGGAGGFEIHDFPAERKQIDIGDYWTDDSAFRDLTGWRPRMPLAEGLARSLDFFRTHFQHYVKGLA
jgi:UDP-glucose 4-epimerase